MPKQSAIITFTGGDSHMLKFENIKDFDELKARLIAVGIPNLGHLFKKIPGGACIRKSQDQFNGSGWSWQLEIHPSARNLRALESLLSPTNIRIMIDDVPQEQVVHPLQTEKSRQDPHRRSHNPTYGYLRG